MVLRKKKEEGGGAQQAPRPAPRAQTQFQSSPAYGAAQADFGGLERRWADAWNRARAGQR